MSSNVRDIREGILIKLNREFNQNLAEMGETAQELQDEPDNKDLKDRHNKAVNRCNELEVEISALEEELFGVKTTRVIVDEDTED